MIIAVFQLPKVGDEARRRSFHNAFFFTLATNADVLVGRVEVPVIARSKHSYIRTAQIAPSHPPSGEFLEAAANVRVGVRRAAVVDVEQA